MPGAFKGPLIRFANPFLRSLPTKHHVPYAEFNLLNSSVLSHCVAKVCSAMSSVTTAAVQHCHIDRMF